MTSEKSDDQQIHYNDAVWTKGQRRKVLRRVLLSREQRHPHWGVTIIGALAIFASVYFMFFLGGRRKDPGPYIICQAAIIGDVDTVSYMLNRSNKSKDLQNARLGGASVVHWAAAGGSLRVMEILYQHHANLNAFDSRGTTPLHVAAMEGHEDVTRFLLENGVDPSPQDRFGCTPLDWAIAFEHNVLAQILQDNGGYENKAPPEKYLKRR